MPEKKAKPLTPDDLLRHSKEALVQAFLHTYPCNIEILDARASRIELEMKLAAADKETDRLWAIVERLSEKIKALPLGPDTFKKWEALKKRRTAAWDAHDQAMTLSCQLFEELCPSAEKLEVTRA